MEMSCDLYGGTRVPEAPEVYRAEYPHPEIEAQATYFVPSRYAPWIEW